MSSRNETRQLALRLHALAGDPELRRKAAARELARLHPFDATQIIEDLIGLVAEGWEPGLEVLGCFVAALSLEASSIPHAATLRRLADVQDLERVAALFPDAPAAREMDPTAAKKKDARFFTESLGHLRQKARMTRNPDELSRLATATDAAVVKNILLNPRMTEDLVVRIAARRPARPEPLVEIWKSPRWSVCHRVRRALVFNPYLPTDVGAKIVPLLNSVDLRELAYDTTVHESLRQEAKLLLAKKEPEPSRAEASSSDSPDREQV